MKSFISSQELEALGDGLSRDYMEKTNTRNSMCFDIEGFITDYLGLTILYETFAEKDSTKVGFLANGVAPLLVIRNQVPTPIVFPKDTIVIEKSLLRDKESSRRRFTLAHEAAHKIIEQHAYAQAAPCFHSSFEKEADYSKEILKRVRKNQLISKLQAGEKWKQEPPFEDMVFTAQYGVPVRCGDVNRTIKKVVAKVNMGEKEVAKYEDREPFVLKVFSPHCFRHTFITRCKKNGISYDTIQPYVGHSSLKTTMHYDHNKPEIDRSGLEKISFLGVV